MASPSSLEAMVVGWDVSPRSLGALVVGWDACPRSLEALVVGWVLRVVSVDMMVIFKKLFKKSNVSSLHYSCIHNSH